MAKLVLPRELEFPEPKDAVVEPKFHDSTRHKGKQSMRTKAPQQEAPTSSPVPDMQADVPFVEGIEPAPPKERKVKQPRKDKRSASFTVKEVAVAPPAAKPKTKPRKPRSAATKKTVSEAPSVNQVPDDKQPAVQLSVVAEEPRPDAEAPKSSHAARARYTHCAYDLPARVQKNSFEHDYCETEGIAFVEQRVPRNPHGLAALQRYYATAYALCRLCEMQGDTHVVDVYGNARTYAIAAKLRDAKVPINVTVKGPTLVPADILRRTPDLDVEASDFNALLLVNVYALGDLPLVPSNLAALMASYGVTCAAIVNHTFPAAAGVVARTGAYIRVSDRLVIARPSPSDRIYGPHDPCDWLLAEGAADGIVWARDRAFGQMDVIIVRTSPMVHTPYTIPPPIRWTSVDVPDQRTWMGWVAVRAPTPVKWCLEQCALVPHLRGFVNRDLVLKAKARLAHTRITVNTLRSAHTALIGEISGKELRPIFQCFPDEVHAMVQTSLEQAQVELATDETLRIEAFNAYHGDSLALRAQELNAIGNASRPRPVWPWVLGFFACIMFVAPLRRMAWEIAKGSFRGLASSVRGVVRDTRELMLHPGSEPMSLLPSRYAALSAFAEETVRYGVVATLVAATGPLGLALSYCYPLGVALYEKPTLLHVVKHVALHTLALVSPVVGLLTHLFVNTAVSDAVARMFDNSPWAKFKATVLEAPIEDVDAIDDPEVAASEIQPYSMAVRDRMDITPLKERPWPALSSFKKAHGLESLVGTHGTATYTYYGIGWNVAVYTPGNSNDVAAEAIRRRLLKRTPLETHPSVKYHPDGKIDMDSWEARYDLYCNAWRSIKNTLSALVAQAFAHTDICVAPPTKEEAFELWYGHLRQNRAKLLAAYEANNSMRVWPGPIQLMIKRNELLGKHDHVLRNGFEQFAMVTGARTIGAQKPTEVAFCGPSITVAYNRLKDLFSPKRLGTIPLHYISDEMPPAEVLAGKWRSPILSLRAATRDIPDTDRTFSHYAVYGPISDIELAHIATEVRNSVHEIVVTLYAGDDSLILAKLCRPGTADQLECLAIENDFTQYDASQYTVTQKCAARVLTIAGLDLEVAENMVEGASANYVYVSPVDKTRVVIDVAALGERKTGDAGTTAFNTVVNHGATAHAIYACGGIRFLRTLLDSQQRLTGLVKLKAAYLDLGLSAKVQVRDDFTGATFLKLVLLPAERDLSGLSREVYLALLLPSQVIKRTKSVRDPRIIYGEKDLKTAMLQFLHDAALGLASAWLPPPLEAFQRKYLAEEGPVSPSMRRYVDPEEQYRMSFDPGNYYGVAKRLWRPDQLAMQRWGVERYGPYWEHVDSLCALIREAPKLAFIQHPLCAAMMVADYA